MKFIKISFYEKVYKDECSYIARYIYNRFRYTMCKEDVINSNIADYLSEIIKDMICSFVKFDINLRIRSMYFTNLELEKTDANLQNEIFNLDKFKEEFEEEYSIDKVEKYLEEMRNHIKVELVEYKFEDVPNGDGRAYYIPLEGDRLKPFLD